MKNYKNFSEDYIDLSIDYIQNQYDDLNNLLFDGKLEKIPIKLEINKNSAARIISTKEGNQPEKLNYLGISKYFKMKKSIFRDILAHEMIHVYMIQNHIKDYGGYHGIIFKKMMDEINKKGFNVTIVHTSHHSEINDLRVSKTKVGVAIMHNKDLDEYSITVIKKDVFLNTLENNEVKLRYYIKNKKQNYDIYYLLSDYYKLKIYPCIRKSDSNFYILEKDLFNEIIDNSEIIKKISV